MVEEDDRLRKSLVDILRDEGFVTDFSADGEEGLYKLRKKLGVDAIETRRGIGYCLHSPAGMGNG